MEQIDKLVSELDTHVEKTHAHDLREMVSGIVQRFPLAIQQDGDLLARRTAVETLWNIGTYEPDQIARQLEEQTDFVEEICADLGWEKP